MQTILLVVLVLSGFGLVALVLLQQGKGADAGAAFGSGASSTVFGSRGSGSFMTKSTSVLATVFFMCCLMLAYLSTQGTKQISIVDSVTERSATEEAADSMQDALKQEAQSDMPSIPSSDMPAGQPATQPGQ